MRQRSNPSPLPWGLNGIYNDLTSSSAISAKSRGERLL